MGWLAGLGRAGEGRSRAAGGVEEVLGSMVDLGMRGGVDMARFSAFFFHEQNQDL